MTLQTQTAVSQLKQSHLDEWTVGSAVDLEIVLKNLVSLNDRREIARKLGWKAYPDTYPLGWWAEDYENSFGQFKPNHPIRLPDELKPSKYLTPKKETAPYDAIRLSMPKEPDYWQTLEDDPSQLLVVTEGVKKSAAGLSAGVATLAIAGVDMGVRKIASRYELVPTLKRYAVPGRRVCLAFDSDILVKPEVQQALKRVAKLLEKAGCRVTVAQLPAATKGMDDFIVANGADAFQELVGDAIAFEDWLKGLEGQMTPRAPGIKPPKPAAVADRLAERYRPTLAFNPIAAAFYCYEAEQPGVWSQQTDYDIQRRVQTELKSQPETSGNYDLNYVRSIIGLLKGELLVKNWHEPPGLLPFRNGVLDLASGKSLPHSPSYRFTWAMPRAHDPKASDWSTIDRWLDQATGSKPRLKNVLLCWLNACLKGRADLQRFLHLTGPGGSGKGTFMRLCVALVGDRNNHSSTLQEWCGNRFEAANAYQKRLVSFWDEDKFSGGLSRFKSLTGGDPLRGELKGKQAFAFTFSGMAMLSSNFPIFAGDSSSGMTRRALVVPLNNPVAPGVRRNLEADFAPELAALSNYVLAIPDQVVTSTLLQTVDESSDVLAQTWDYRMRTDSVAAWLNECVVYDRLAQEQVGNDRSNDQTLFGSYWQYCDRTGSRPKGSREFSPALLDLCSNVLGWDVAKKSTMHGRFIAGLRLRTAADAHLPLCLEALSVYDGSTAHDGSMTGEHDGLEPLLHKDYDGYDGSTELIVEKNQNVDRSSKNNLSSKESEVSPVIPVMPAQAKDSSRHAHPSMTDGSPVMKVGSTVHKQKYRGWSGTVEGIEGAMATVRWVREKFSEQIPLSELRPDERATG